MKNLILLKLGGSLITNKDIEFSLKEAVINRLSKEIAGYKKESKTLLIIGHGGGSYPHVPATKSKTALGIINESSYEGISKVQDEAAKLNRIVVHYLIKNKLNAVSVSPSSSMITQDGQIIEAFIPPLERLLSYDMLPVIYGDVVFDNKRGCSILSTEKILNYLALKLNSQYKIKRIIYCGITDGVYDNSGKTIQSIQA